jgi:hypothetical protein
MPALTDPRQETFAQACAAGSNQSAAYIEAGFAANRGNACKLAAKPAMAARIVELRRLRDPIQRACLHDTVIDLMALFQSADALKSAAGAREARLARLEAHRLWVQLTLEEARNARPVERELTLDEWMAKYGPEAQQA